jgi:hypothetical protein
VKTRKDGVVTARVNGMLAVSRSLGDNSLRHVLTVRARALFSWKLTCTLV